jgi:hypothetical protein
LSLLSMVDLREVGEDDVVPLLVAELEVVPFLGGEDKRAVVLARREAEEVLRLLLRLREVELNAVRRPGRPVVAAKRLRLLGEDDGVVERLREDDRLDGRESRDVRARVRVVRRLVIELGEEGVALELLGLVPEGLDLGDGRDEVDERVGVDGVEEEGAEAGDDVELERAPAAQREGEGKARERG